MGSYRSKMGLMDENAESTVGKTGLVRAERHLFLCAGPDCCAAEPGQAVWQAMKRLVRERNLPVFRTKAACLRICRGGPWLVVYPEGIWYGEMTPERLEEIVERHIEGGEPIESWIAFRRPLTKADG
jgi:(2Fe-2S) ferredoxin